MENLIVLNNKMNLPINMEEFDVKLLKNKIIYCPAFLYLNRAFKYIKLGSQDVSSHEKGSYTGEISANILKNVGVLYSIVGHSERREYFNEDLVVIVNKIHNLINEGIIPILCVSETVDEEELEFLLNEVVDISHFIIAYEPISAIGTNEVPLNNQIEMMVKKIKDIVNKLKKEEVRVLYGGSVNSSNIKTLKDIPNIDGFLIGNASLKVDEIRIILEVLEK
ncbi:MAG: triose-phosphate isomerase family protein [Bacilli bacterium]